LYIPQNGVSRKQHPRWKAFLDVRRSSYDFPAVRIPNSNQPIKSCGHNLSLIRRKLRRTNFTFDRML
jgi:hypothetical protein